MSEIHTQGRITFKEDGDANRYSMLTEDGKWWLALLANGEMTSARQIANFRRLAACWNAFEGVPTEQIEQSCALSATKGATKGATPAAPKRCACCGGDAGCWVQWHNQDAGWGLCASCAPRIVGKGMSADEMDHTYGKEGVHRETPTHALSARRFRVMVSFPDTDAGADAANAYMEANEGACVLDVTAEGEIVLAHFKDNGIPL